MSTTRRGFLKLLGVGSVAAPTLLKAALKKPDVPVPVVTSGYCQVISCGSCAIGFDPSNYEGEYVWSQTADNDAPFLKTDAEGNPVGWTMVRNWYPPTNKK